ncbi:hypothetical protein C8J56DRAFT_883617 [Mycena floridula]|nr:hypothetical protein C8J56DRAFT_883617 [Mycena floridula]
MHLRYTVTTAIILLPAALAMVLGAPTSNVDLYITNIGNGFKSLTSNLSAMSTTFATSANPQNGSQAFIEKVATMIDSSRKQLVANLYTASIALQNTKPSPSTPSEAILTAFEALAPPITNALKLIILIFAQCEYHGSQDDVDSVVRNILAVRSYMAVFADAARVLFAVLNQLGKPVKRGKTPFFSGLILGPGLSPRGCSLKKHCQTLPEAARDRALEKAGQKSGLQGDRIELGSPPLPESVGQAHKTKQDTYLLGAYGLSPRSCLLNKTH